MSFLSDLFGSKDQTSTTSVQYPAWVDNASQGIWTAAQGIAGQGYKPYPFKRIAGMSGDQLDAQAFLRGFKPKELGAGYKGIELPGMLDDVKGWTTQDYMNPFLNNVMRNTQRSIREGADMAHQWTSNVAAHGDNAFGDARHGIADAEIEKDATRQIGEAADRAYSQAYDTAMGLKDTDISRLFQGAQFDREAQDQVLKYIDALYRSGNNTQSLDQANADLMYSDFQNQNEYPTKMLQLLISALGGSPYGSSTSSTSPGTSTAGSILGAGANLAAIINAL